MRSRLVLLFAALALAVGACSSGGSSAASRPVGSEEVVVVPAMGEIALGTQRFTFAAFTTQGEAVEAAGATVQFVLLQGQQDLARQSVSAVYYRIEVETPHLHQAGDVHGHVEAKGFFLVDAATFDTSGFWRADVTLAGGPAAGRKGSLAFEVQSRGTSPALGAPAPATKNPTAKGLQDLAELTSRTPPYPPFHQMSIEEALQSRRPFVVAFATPAFCVSAICGPVLEIVRSVADTAGDKAVFIQIEPYDLKIARTQGRLSLVPAGREWGLQSEPWVFVVDREGRVAAKFEGLLTPQELLDAVNRVAS